MHEIKHDGFRIIAVRAGGKVKLFSRRGNDFTDRFPAAVAAIAALEARSCILDGEAIVVDENGLSIFEMLRSRHHDDAALLCAFDVIEFNGNDLRRQRFEARKSGPGAASARRSGWGSRQRPLGGRKARRSTSTPARSAARASYRSRTGLRFIAPAAVGVG